MRLLAERLETRTATLYRHVTSKDELMVYVLDSRMGQIVGAYDALAARPRTWREALERIAFAYRRFLVAHPNVLPLLVGRLPIGPHALTIRERSLAALTERGFSQELAARAFTTLLQYVVGSAVTQAGSPAPDEAAAIRDYYRSLDAAAYPHVAGQLRRSRTHRARRGSSRAWRSCSMASIASAGATRVSWRAAARGKTRARGGRPL